jgi:hypothetical protein
VVAGDTVFDRVYFGVPKDKAREDWMKTLDQISALQPAILIPAIRVPVKTRKQFSSTPVDPAADHCAHPSAVTEICFWARV